MMAVTFQHLRHALLDITQHNGIPGYQLMPCATRWRLNLHSLVLFVASVTFVRVALWLSAWLLAGCILVWHLDVRGPATLLPAWTACLWLWPCCASIRRGLIRKLLGNRWPER
jgi:hypothetical protein